MAEQQVTWISSSVAEDLLMVALADATDALAASQIQDAAIIGGVMVELLVRSRSMSLHRVTKDVDIGMHLRTLQTHPLPDELARRDYRPRHGNVYEKESRDPPGQASIDLLVPAYRTRQSRPRRAGKVVTVEVGMLSEALQTAQETTLRVVSLAGVERRVVTRVPTPLAALALKLSVWNARRENKDAFDVWRCLEIARHDELRAADWGTNPDLKSGVEDIWRSGFSTVSSEGVLAAVAYAHLDGPTAERRAAQIVLLGRQLFEPEAPVPQFGPAG